MNSDRQHTSPFEPVATRKSAAQAAATTNQDFPRLRTGVGTVRHTQGRDSVPSTNRRPIVETIEDEELDYPEPRRRARTSSIYREAAPTRRLPQTRLHWFVWVGLAMFIMIIGWLSFSALSSWWSGKLNDWTYGNPRTYQTDFVVGHGDSAEHPSHFLEVKWDHFQDFLFPAPQFLLRDRQSAF